MKLHCLLNIADIDKECIQKYGWYAHYVPSGDTTPFGANYHTHGFPEKFDHPDIQICMPIPNNSIHSLGWRAVEYIEAGNKFEPGKFYDCILENHSVQFIHATECGRPVLRMILPDKEGRFDTDPYCQQFLLTEHKID